MGFPNDIERTLDLRHPPEAVWRAIATEDGLSHWFGQKITLDVRPGGTGTMGWDQNPFVQQLRVERIEAESAFGFTWLIYGLPDGDPRRTYVEFTLEPVGTGTRLRLVESGFAQLDGAEHRTAIGGNRDGWTGELKDLVAHLDAA